MSLLGETFSVFGLNLNKSILYVGQGALDSDLWANCGQRISEDPQNKYITQ